MPNQTARTSFAGIAVWTLGALLLWLAVPMTVSACSPPFEPSLRKLGPNQVVVVGTIGDRVAAGRVFHVERWFNGGVPAGRILIAFKEGEPIGDCSYLVSAGQRLIIAPFEDLPGRLSADLGTLQADPASEEGRAYMQEAQDLYGPGIVPALSEPPPDAPTPPDLVGIVVGVGLVAVLVFVSVIALARRGRAS